MYGVERSVVVLVREVGKVDGKAMLEVIGRLGVTGVGAVPLSVLLFGRSQAVYTSLCQSSCPKSWSTQGQDIPYSYQPGT